MRVHPFTRRRWSTGPVLALGAVVATMVAMFATVPLRPRRADAVGFPAGAVSITFDDGWGTQFTNARPLMNARGFKGTYYLISQSVRDSYSCCLNVAQVQTLKADGNELGSHSVTHPDLTSLTPAALDSELRDSKAYLESTFGVSVPTFASPYGLFNPTVLSAIRSVYRVHRGVTAGLADADSYVDQLPSYIVHNTTPVAAVKAIIDSAIAQKKWAILTFHDIVTAGASTDIQYNRADFTAILDYLRTKRVPVVTMSQGVANLNGRITPPESGLTIYDDSLRNGFDDWSYAVRNLAQTAAVHAGSAAISFEPDGYAGLLFHAAPVALSAFDALEFWVNGGSTGGQNVIVSFANGSVFGQTSVSAALGRPIPANTWTKVTIPLASLGIAPTASLVDLYFADGSGANQSAVYLDDVRLTPNGVATTTTAQATTTVATTAVPTTTTVSTTSIAPTTTLVSTTTIPATTTTAPTTTTTTPASAPFVVYDDALQNGFQNWSWAVNDPASTATVHAGARAFRFEPDSWSAMYLHSDAGVIASRYRTLRFWIFATGVGGQRIDVAFYDGTLAQGRVSVATLLGGPLVAGRWQEVVVPLANVGLSAGTVRDVYFQDMSGANQDAVVVDDIRLVA